MSPARLVPLTAPTTSVAEGWAGKDGVATGKTPFATPPLARPWVRADGSPTSGAASAAVLPATRTDGSRTTLTPSAVGSPTTPSSAEIGFKAERLGAALRAGLPVLPGFVVPATEARPALQAAASAVRAHGIAAGRLEVLHHSIDSALTEELRGAVDALGGRVIVRSSSPLESDGRWAGAFSSVTGVGRGDVAAAVRSCWASAFALDPLRRLEGCGLELEALDLAVLVQPEIVPNSGGVARITANAVVVEGVHGHPGALLAGWAEGARDGALAELVGSRTVADAAEVAERVYAEVGDDVIEWAGYGGKVWLLQSLRSGTSPGGEPAAPLPVAGTRVPGRPVVPGTAAGPLVACRPHEPAARDCQGAIVLVDRPVPGLAPLLFGARGVISRAGAASSHLAEVACSLGVPMVIGCRPEVVTGPDPAVGAWFATINGGTGEVVLTRRDTGRMSRRSPAKPTSSRPCRPT
jgi:phosphoenolpyruvate synthase/pyruvate phosphate dikinase